MNKTNQCAGASASLSRVRQLLLHATPENLDSAIVHLQAAATCLEAVRQEVSTPGCPHFAGELRGLKDEVAAVTALLHHAGRFHLGWAAFLASSGPEYGLAGRLFPAPSSSRVCVDG